MLASLICARVTASAAGSMEKKLSPLGPLMLMGIDWNLAGRAQVTATLEAPVLTFLLLLATRLLVLAPESSPGGGGESYSSFEQDADAKPSIKRARR